ncbi:MarR family winged helix-turn-helix transcriptional regulator [Williamsia sp. SKLECPSW1]
MDDGLADLLHRVVAIFGEIARSRIASASTSAGLTYTQIRIIGSLEESPRMTQRQLADVIGLSEAATSRALRTLRDAGFVETVVDETHAGRRLATATRAGLDTFHSSGVAMESELRDWLVREGFPYEDYVAESKRLADLLASLTRTPTAAPSHGLPRSPG